MDRKSFLSCQSFLYPLRTSLLPNDSSDLPIDDSKTGESTCFSEVLLSDMRLSIEPCENSNFHKKKKW